MKHNESNINYLMKITLTLEIGTTPERMDLTQHPVKLDFVYGVAASGILLFEKALFGKKPGDVVMIPVERKNLEDMFGYLKEKIDAIIPDTASFYMKMHVQSVSIADPREVVHAIASGTGSADCDCGCGCS